MKVTLHGSEPNVRPACLFKHRRNVVPLGKGKGAWRPGIRRGPVALRQERRHGLPHHTHPRIVLGGLPDQHAETPSRNQGRSQMGIGQDGLGKEHPPKARNQRVKGLGKGRFRGVGAQEARRQGGG